MNPISTLVTSLRTELGLTTAPRSAASTADVATLERTIMEGAVSSFLADSDGVTTASFLQWVEQNQTKPTLMTEVFEHFPPLLAAVHAQLVTTIELAKAKSVSE